MREMEVVDRYDLPKITGEVTDGKVELQAKAMDIHAIDKWVEDNRG